jgi:hypothetical protein
VKYRFVIEVKCPIDATLLGMTVQGMGYKLLATELLATEPPLYPLGLPKANEVATTGGPPAPRKLPARSARAA